MRQGWLGWVICLLLGGPLQGPAVANIVPGVGADVEEVEEDPSPIDIAHERISRGITAPVEWLDAFFADERIEEEEGRTRLRLRLSSVTSETETLQTRVRPNLRLDFPLLSERFHLLVTGDREEDEEDGRLPGEVPDRFSSAAEQRASVSLRYFFVSTLRRNASLRSGLRLRSSGPLLFIEPRYRQSWALSEPWQLRFTQRLIAESDGGIEARTTVDLERPLGPSLFFRSTAEGSWFREEEGYFYHLLFALYQPLSRNRVVQYAWVNSFVTRPTHVLEEALLRVTYRQRLWRDWLFAEIAPQASFPRERDYRFTPGLLLRLEVIFGFFDRPITESVRNAQ